MQQVQLLLLILILFDSFLTSGLVNPFNLYKSISRLRGFRWIFLKYFVWTVQRSNSVDPDHKPRFVASELDLHCFNVPRAGFQSCIG